MVPPNRQIYIYIYDIHTQSTSTGRPFFLAPFHQVIQSDFARLQAETEAAEEAAKAEYEEFMEDSQVRFGWEFGGLNGYPLVN